MKSVMDMTDQELAQESGRLIERTLQVLDEFHRRHPDLPIYQLLAISILDSPWLKTISEKRRLATMPPASKDAQ